MKGIYISSKIDVNILKKDDLVGFKYPNRSRPITIGTNSLL
ncbi:MAG: hypothetical protein BAJALOKI2v1_100076 [Promethearchaeota archaeon]|nr:MAG: hypothetical protein BAJALOKI2v1_100076 [Candidatus Lokiarchaeota archaeon]